MSEGKKTRSEDADKRNRGTSSPQSTRPYQEKEEGTTLWGILLFGLGGATAAIFTLSRSRASWKDATAGSFRKRFREEAQKRYNRRMQEEYEDEMERLERIRRMQSVFNRGRNKYKKSYESWTEDAPGVNHQHFQRNDWYWKADNSYREWTSNYKEAPRNAATYHLSHHYSILGLDRLRTIPYTDDEIKTAFRAKAMEFHPDQNQENKEVAEAKFKEVMVSYEAIKFERKNNKF